MLGKILMMNNFRKQHVDWYCICKLTGDTINHLLLHSAVARVSGQLFVWNFMGYAQNGN